MAYISTSHFIQGGGLGRNSSRAGIWRQELIAETIEDATYWLALHSLLCFYRTQGHNGLGPPTTITHFKNTLQACLHLDLKDAFFKLLSPPLRDDFSLRQVDVKLFRSATLWEELSACCPIHSSASVHRFLTQAFPHIHTTHNNKLTL